MKTAFGALILFVVAGLFLFGCIQPETPPVNGVCAQDLKTCADGNTVGRIPPNCEFAACPSNPPDNNTISPVLSKPFKVETYLLKNGFRIPDPNAPVQAGAISDDPALRCTRNEDCTYVQNPPNSPIGACLNLNEIDDLSGLNIDSTIPCFCRQPIGIPCDYFDENTNLCLINAEHNPTEGPVSEENPFPSCEILTPTTDVVVSDLNVLPQNPILNVDDINFSSNIRNNGVGQCSLLVVSLDFGDNTSTIAMYSFCGHYFTPQQCQEMGVSAYFNPGAQILFSTTRPAAFGYSTVGTYDVNFDAGCNQIYRPGQGTIPPDDLNYSNNHTATRITVS